MEESSVIALKDCKKVIQYNNFFNNFFLGGDNLPKDSTRYQTFDDALKAYLMTSEAQQDSILIYRSEHLNPPREGEWIQQSKVNRYMNVAYSVNLDQFLRLIGLKEDRDIRIRYFKISQGEAKEVVHESLVREWWVTISPEVKRRWLDVVLEEFLFRKVVENPRRFLELK